MQAGGETTFFFLRKLSHESQRTIGQWQSARRSVTMCKSVLLRCKADAIRVGQNLQRQRLPAPRARIDVTTKAIWQTIAQDVIPSPLVFSHVDLYTKEPPAAARKYES